MSTLFEDACRRTRERIVVPPVPIEAIRAHALLRDGKTTNRRRRVLLALLMTLSIAAAAAATELLNVRISFDETGPIQVYAIGAKAIPHPARTDFEDAVREVNFPVVLPVGLPPHTTPNGLVRLAKSALIISYDLPGKSRSSDHVLHVILADPKALTMNDALPRLHVPMEFEIGRRSGTNTLWRTGGEDVIVLSSRITENELAHLKSAMLAAVSSRSGNAAALAAVPAANPSAPPGTRVSFERDGTLRLSSDSMMQNDPCGTTDAAVRQCVSHMEFPVVLPTGLPKGTTVTNFGLHDARAAVIFYDLPGAARPDHLLKIMLIDPRIVVAHDNTFDRATYAGRFPGARGATRWTIGHEQVIFLRNTLTADELAAVKAAMTAATSKH